MGLIGVYNLEYDLEKRCSLSVEQYTVFSDEIMVEKASIAYKIFNQVFFPSMKTEEYVYLMCCDARMRVKGLFVVSQGGVTGALQNIRGIIVRTLLCNASSIIVAHNHPSGECNVSKEDKKCCKKLKEVCKLMEISLEDNLILGDGKYLSFREEGLL